MKFALLINNGPTRNRLWSLWAPAAAALLLVLLGGCGGEVTDAPPDPPPTKAEPRTLQPTAPPPIPTPTIPPKATAGPSPEAAIELSPTPSSGATDTPPPLTPTAPVSTATPALTAPTATRPAVPEAPAQLVLVFGQGTVVRYLVKEQFVRRNLPNDAIGETGAVGGSIVFGPDGAVQPDLSKITIQLRTLRSDEDDRDEFLEDRSLESIKFPLAEYVVEQTPGLPWPLPQAGEISFQLRGSMTMHGVTSPLAWEVVARFSPDGATGRAKTSFKFDKFDIEKPSLFFLLSVEDNIRLELDFVLSINSGR